MKNLVKFIQEEVKDTMILMRNIPSGVMVLFVISVVLMNLLANKEIATGISWLVLDAGFTMSWFSFLCMDMLTKRFGPRASIKLSLVAVVVNLFCAGVFKMVSMLPGNWGEFYAFENDIVNQALNNTIGGTWYILFGSTVAFTVSAIANALMNHAIGKMMKKKNFTEYAVRSYVSTILAQFVDNFIFALIVSKIFFGWTILQCVVASLAGCVVELIGEIIFSPFGYKVCKKWEEENVGSGYLDKLSTGKEVA